MQQDLKSRRSYGARAVVTGAGSGIGKAFALRLAERESAVVCADIDLVAAKETAASIERGGGKAIALACDVAEQQKVLELADAAEDWFHGAADLVINNAGIGSGGTLIGQTPLENWQRTLNINLWGVVHGCHVFTPRLRAAGRGGIINVASAAAFAAGPTMGEYNVSKAGVLALSETLRAELAGTGIKVTVLCPTFVKTNIMAGPLIAESVSGFANRLMRWTGVSPEKIARTTLDAHDRGKLYVVPQLDAKAVWQLKRHLPTLYTNSAGIANRLLKSFTQGG